MARLQRSRRSEDVYGEEGKESADKIGTEVGDYGDIEKSKQ